jgi:hypothetical protein
MIGIGNMLVVAINALVNLQAKRKRRRLLTLNLKQILVPQVSHGHPSIESLGYKQFRNQPLRRLHVHKFRKKPYMSICHTKSILLGREAFSLLFLGLLYLASSSCAHLKFQPSVSQSSRPKNFVWCYEKAGFSGKVWVACSGSEETLEAATQLAMKSIEKEWVPSYIILWKSSAEKPKVVVPPAPL